MPHAGSSHASFASTFLPSSQQSNRSSKTTNPARAVGQKDEEVLSRVPADSPRSSEPAAAIDKFPWIPDARYFSIFTRSTVKADQRDFQNFSDSGSSNAVREFCDGFSLHHRARSEEDQK
jgi:hypothetical protein